MIIETLPDFSTPKLTYVEKLVEYSIVKDLTMNALFLSSGAAAKIGNIMRNLTCFAIRFFRFFTSFFMCGTDCTRKVFNIVFNSELIWKLKTGGFIVMLWKSISICRGRRPRRPTI